MLSHVDAIATVATRDLARAREFYTNVLGLEEEDAGATCPGVLTYRSGNSRIFVYQSEYAGSNQATAINWDVGLEIRTVVDTLKAKGARFEQYQMAGMRLEDDIHVGEQMKVAWLKDPDGNILSIIGK
ncbi:VOC family protein [Massilia sp. ZL223]|uniref:VOC family protein n=1 Tax=Massilia sp. ZL223 TaxID=2824904 RepID=UPI001B831BEC|nr:VOC family protein [Massilia sp. ZL223]MBQ5963778.1 VOC family protein [Massilia sp. ZL223]